MTDDIVLGALYKGEGYWVHLNNRKGWTLGLYAESEDERIFCPADNQPRLPTIRVPKEEKYGWEYVRSILLQYIPVLRDPFDPMSSEDEGLSRSGRAYRARTTKPSWLDDHGFQMTKVSEGGTVKYGRCVIGTLVHLPNGKYELTPVDIGRRMWLQKELFEGTGDSLRYAIWKYIEAQQDRNAKALEDGTWKGSRSDY